MKTVVLRSLIFNGALQAQLLISASLHTDFSACKRSTDHDEPI